MVRFPFIPKEERFFGLFEQSARNMVKAAEALQGLLDTCGDVVKSVAEIAELEHQGDTITHQIMAIALLAHTLDDVTDFIDKAADAILIYRIECPTLRAKELADVIVQASIEIEKVLPKLRRRAELKQVLERCVEINRLENVADRIFRAAMAELFDDNIDIAQVIKWREIYEYMETATDRCEDVANVLEGVALKHA